ncbi:hypothetical protein MHZ93_03995 [Roseomonas sp. ACRSG]|nr:hypothetical protein [Roseomonas sp. ACRSG]
MTQSHAYWQGSATADTTWVASAAGRLELEEGRPVVGQTGDNIDLALPTLNRLWPEAFPFFSRWDYYITNASNEVHFQSCTGRTEARNKDILNPTNLERLQAAVGNRRYVVLLGKKALVTAKAAKLGGVWFYGCHPSLSAVNRKYKLGPDAVTLSSSERNALRLSKWAADIQQIPRS